MLRTITEDYKAKVIASFFIIQMLLTVVTPLATYGLTSGPSAPEYATFEPYNSTNMVQLSSGDFVYNLPLINVPSPEGGYPINISYQAGIFPNQEASWVGLGWNLNVGAINRRVNNYPDDLKSGVQDVNTEWLGKWTEYFAFGIGYDMMSFGYERLQDPFKGVSENMYGGLMGINIGKPMDNGGGSNAAPTVGVIENVSTNEIKGNLDFFGIQEVPYYYGSARMSSRGYISESDITYASGVLYPNTSFPNANSISYDSHVLVDPNAGDVYQSNTAKQLGGSLPSYDSYQVLGSNVGGVISPYIYENGNLYRQNSYEKLDEEGNPENFDIEYKRVGQNFSDKGIQFRYVADFSNKYVIQDKQITADPDNVPTLSASYLNEGFNTETNHLAGSKHIEWFTNRELITNVKNGKSVEDDYGFIPFRDSKGSLVYEYIKYEASIENQIGGFMITDPNGINYHYALPVYAYGETSRYDLIDQSNGKYYKASNKSYPYAYTWLLTSITGPDYVDRGNKGLDDTDYGYWVQFDYGKWTDKYKWRTPEQGSLLDVDGDFETHSKGYKELYYLDAVKTRTHTALFIKSLRNDGKGTSLIYDLDKEGFYSQFLKDNRTTLDFENDGDNFSGDVNAIIKDNSFFTDTKRTIYGAYKPVSTLKLDEVIVIKNSDLEDVLSQNAVTDLKNHGKQYNHTNTGEGEYQSFVESGNFPLLNLTSLYSYPIQDVIQTVQYHYGDQVIDARDFFGIKDQLLDKSLRSVYFDHDYSLAKGTINSYSNYHLYEDFSISRSKEKDGKLTLNSIHVLGNGGVETTPSTDFYYGKNPTNEDVEKHDSWGYYKSDYDPSVYSENAEMGRLTTTASANDVDAWSLSKIVMPTGASVNIEYESDEYKQTYYPIKKPLLIKSLTHQGNLITAKLHGNTPIDIRGKLNSGTTIKCIASFRTSKSSSFLSGALSGFSTLGDTYRWDIIEKDVVIQQVGTDYITFNDTQIATALQQGRVMLASNILVYPENNAKKKGGGLRVRSVSVEDNERIFYSNYVYENGKTTYEPASLVYKKKNLLAVNDGDKSNEREAISKLKSRLNEGVFSELASKASFIPSPNVHYGEVTVYNSVYDKATKKMTNDPSKRVYTYKNYEESKVFERSATEQTKGNNKVKRVLLRNYSGRTSGLEKVEMYGPSGLLTRQTYVSFSDLYANNTSYRNALSSKYDNQGRVDQLFHERRRVKNEAGIYDEQLVVTKLEQYVDFPVKTITEEFKHNIRQETSIDGYDFFSGKVTRYASNDVLGNQFLQEKVPAYVKYPQFGLKVKDITKSHMLHNEAASYVLKVNGNTTNGYEHEAVVNGSAIYYSTSVPAYGRNGELNTKVSKLPLPTASYFFQGSMERNDGLFDLSDVDNNGDNVFDAWNEGFQNWSGNLPNPLWKKVSEITKNNTFSSTLEEMDENGNSSAIRMDPLLEKTIMAATNSQYSELAYCGAEYEERFPYGEGGVKISNYTTTDQVYISTEEAHSGGYSVVIAPQKQAMHYTIPATVASIKNLYKAAVWVHFPNSNIINEFELKVTGGTVKQKGIASSSKKSKNWYLVETIVEANNADLKFYCENGSTSNAVYVDDFRVQPVDADAQTFVYDPITEALTYVFDNDNLYTKFTYDAGGRLTKKEEEHFYIIDQITTEKQYNYGKK